MTLAVGPPAHTGHDPVSQIVGDAEGSIGSRATHYYKFAFYEKFLP